MQEGVIQSYTGDTKAPYLVQNKNQNSITIKCSLAEITGRFEQADGLAHEEKRVEDSIIIKHFETVKRSDLDKVKHIRQSLREGKKFKQQKDGVCEHQGGVTKVYRNQSTTWVNIVYHDEDSEDVKLQDAIVDVAFKEDHNKRLRLTQMRAAIAARIRGHPAPTG